MPLAQPITADAGNYGRMVLSYGDSDAIATVWGTLT